MSYIRRNIISILLFILWLGMAASLTTAHANVQFPDLPHRASLPASD